MTRFSPTLILNRLVIERDGNTVYDEKFHVGVNILRGDNSSGKSTILNFIFYGLGGDLTDWSDVAQLCSKVVVEASFNGLVATLAREISTEPGRPMDVFAGDYDNARVAPMSEWKRYPYRRSASVESFSQVIFRLLGIPEVSNDETGNVTIHQILRLLYADQLSPIEQIFKFERFDPPALRDAVGRLLCGAYDSETYNNDIKIKSLVKRFDGISAELRSLFSILGRAEQAHTLEWIDAQRASLEAQRSKIQFEIARVEASLYTSGIQDSLSLKAQEDAYAEVQRLQRELGSAQEKRDQMVLVIADSDLFISNLKDKLGALADSKAVVENLGAVRFRSCPACYAPVEEMEHDHACHLCKTPFDSGSAQNRLVALVNEAGRQLKQSTVLQERRRQDLVRLQDEVRRLSEEWTHAARKLSEAQSLPSGSARAELRKLTREAGYLDRQAEDLEQKAALAKEIEKLSSEKESLNAEIASLRNRNERISFTLEKRRELAYNLIDREVVGLLKGDLRRQDAFIDAKHVQFDFALNSISVDGTKYFSASSRVILKSSFYVGFLQAARMDKMFRHPRFCILDTIEDKGMEPARSHNFQRLIMERSKRLDVEHQIIFATAMIAPELDIPELTVGNYSTLDNPTINLRGSVVGGLG
ncbi:AAA family ATPase [Xanthobacter sp. 126]|uniref:AAA family ATPase n=1 Tax=Xanthobacter sp. 126 TaxID=1131814 RepID=UPI0004B40C7A|nr:AAA family ATPase [Xanthobacter sp. 126]